MQVASVTAREFVHPGLSLSQNDLERMKEKVLAKEHPWIDGWNKMIAERDAQSDFKASPKSDVGGTDGTRQRASRDATAAFYNIVRWYVTGNTANARCAVDILNDWSKTVNKKVSGELFMLPIWTFMSAAELTRLYDGWADADRQRFEAMVRNYFYPACKEYRDYGGTWPGWGGPANYCCLAIGIYLDDETMFDEAIENFKSGTGGGCIHNGLLPTGQLEEMGRDQPHAEIGINAYADFCQTAWTQGVDLYGYADNLLLKGYEYFCRFNLDHADEVEWTPVSYGGHNFYYPANGNSAPGSMPQNRIYGGGSFQMAYHHYTDIKHLDAPYTRAMINLHPVSVLDGTFHIHTDTTTVYNPLPRPEAPVNLSATPGEGRICLDWQPAEPNRVNGYHIQRSTRPDGGFVTVATFTENCTSEHTDTDVQPGTTYYYRVRARNQSGWSEYSEVAAAAAVEAQPELPLPWAQTDLGAVQTPGNTAWADAQGGSWVVTGAGIDNWNGKQPIGNFTYTMASGDFDIQMRLYDLEQNGSEIKVKVGLAAFASLTTGSQSVFMQLGGSGTRFSALCWRASTDGSMQETIGCDHTWVAVWFRLKREAGLFKGYVSPDGTRWQQIAQCSVAMPTNAYVGLFVCGGQGHPEGVTARFDHLLLTSQTTLPAVPANLKATTQSSTQVRLTWSRSPTAATYVVKRSEEEDGDYQTIARNITTVSYTDTGLNPSTTYFYRVCAANAAGVGDDSEAVGTTTAELKLPSAPTGLKAVPKNNRVVLSWNATAEQTISYNVYRRKASESDMQWLASAVANGFQDTEAMNDTTYFYQVAAVNAVGESRRSNSVKVMPTLGLKIYLRMDEGEGTTLSNEADGSQAATLSDGITWVAGKYGQAIRLTASSQCVATLKRGITSGITDFTITCWVRPAILAQWARVFDFGTGTDEYMFLTIRSDKGHPKFAIRLGGTEQSVEGTSAIPSNVWTHLAVTLQDSTCTLYVNGRAVSRNDAVSHRPTHLGTTTQNYLGKSLWASDPYFTGSLDEFRFYTQAMTAEQIMELYSTDPTPTGIVAVHEPAPTRGMSGYCFDLSGRRIAVSPALPKGIYVIDGKKVFIK